MNSPAIQSASDRIATLTRPEKVPGQVPNLCPYSCPPSRLSPVGYCKHLIGWSVDGETVEIRENVNGKYERTGVLTGVVEDSDVMVNPTPDRRDKNKNPTPTPHFRVYRKTGKAPYTNDGTTFMQRKETLVPELEDDEPVA